MLRGPAAKLNAQRGSRATCRTRSSKLKRLRKLSLLHKSLRKDQVEAQRSRHLLSEIDALVQKYLSCRPCHKSAVKAKLHVAKLLIKKGQALRQEALKPMQVVHQRNSEVEDALSPKKLVENPQELLCNILNIPMTRHKFSCLNPGRWLNDEIINCYFGLLQKRAAGPMRWCTNSFFWEKLLADGAGAVRRWAHRAGVMVKRLEMMIIPMNVSQGTHWATAVLIPNKLSALGSPAGIRYLDPLRLSPPPNLVQLLQAWYRSALDMEMRGDPEKEKIQARAEKWQLLDGSPVAMQQNGSDCGPLACAYAEQLVSGIAVLEAGSLDSSVEAMKAFREKMAAAILQGHV